MQVGFAHMCHIWPLALRFNTCVAFANVCHLATDLKGVSMNTHERQDILRKARDFFKTSIAQSHAANTQKLAKLKNFNVNPFTVHYLASFAFGDESPNSLAKALIYPRVLGTSIATTFGNNVQTFCHEVLGGYASTTAGMDIEFIDALDGRKKYCQLKAGPATINKDDVETIKGHFASLKNLARTNHLSDFNPMTDCCVGILYGDHSQISANYKRIEQDYHVYPGWDFWLHLTGDESFYDSLIGVFSDCAKDYSDTKLLDITIDELAEDITKHPEVLSYEVVSFESE